MSNAFKTPANLLLELFLLILPPPVGMQQDCLARQRLVQHGGDLAQYCQKRTLLLGKNDLAQMYHTAATFKKQW